MFQSLAAKWAARKKKSDEAELEEIEPKIEENEPQIEETTQNVSPENESAEGAPEVENVVPEPETPKKKSLWKIVLGVLVLLLLAGVAGGYYYISNIDWNQHKDKISAEFSGLTGKRIVFDGPIHLTLFPSPSLQAENIKIYNPREDTDEPLAEIKSLVANLTLKALLKGDFDVKMMSLVEPHIRLELLDDDTLNWDTPLTEAQRTDLENVQITLDSVLVKNATIRWIDEKRKKNFAVHNVNAEVIAPSIFGPYRIEGTYIKNDNPEGFAFSIGRINSGLSTSVNAVINQPSTETFVRFDGSVLPQNNAVNGNLIFESKKLMDFVNSNLETYKLKPEYDYPLAVTLELKSNKQKIELNNFAAKYGDSAGAGNLLIPLSAGEYASANDKKTFRPKAELSFNFASLDLNPVVELAQELWDKYKTGEANYNPQLGFDLLADVQAVKAEYNNQSVKDLKLSLDILNNKITLRNLSAVLPGDSAVSLKGDVYSDLGHLTFDLEPRFKTDEFRQTLAWLGFKPQVAKDTLLRRIEAVAKVAGNFNKVSIAPLALQVDNMLINGELALINDQNLSLYAALNTNIFNFDDYFPALVINQPDKSWAENVNARFQKISLSPDIYAELRLSADTMVYNALPYGGVRLNGSLQDKTLQLNSLSIDNMAGAKFDAKGKVSGFGQKAEVQNLKFNLETQNFSELVSKMNLPVSHINLQQMSRFAVSGIVTGFADRFATKSIAQLGSLNIDYGGMVELKNNAYELNGTLDLKSPDFVKTLNDFDFAYAPQTYVLGLFNMHGKFVGNWQKFTASDLQFNIGSNAFHGNVVYDATAEKPDIQAKLNISRFELDKFFYNNAKVKAKQSASFQKETVGPVDFLKQPVFDAEKFNFDFLNSFNFSGQFNIARLTYRGLNFDYCKFSYLSKDNVMQVEDFDADFWGGKIKTDFELSMRADKPSLRGNLVLENVQLADDMTGGDKYGLKEGLFSLSAHYETSAVSFADMYEQLRLNGQFALSDTLIKGWNVKNIYDDLLNRKTSQGLNAFVKSQLLADNERILSANGKVVLNNSVLSIADSSWVGNGYVARLQADANLNNWQGTMRFEIDFNTPDYLPNFYVIYSGALDMPELDVDIEQLAIMYNQREQEIKAQEAAEEAARQAKLRKQIDDALLQTKAMESELTNVLRPDLEMKKQKATMPEAVDSYLIFEKRLDKIDADLTALLLMGQNPEVSEKMQDEIEAGNAQNQKNLDALKQDMQKVNLQNLRFVIAQKKAELLKQNQEALQIAEKYRLQKADLQNRISAIETTYALEKDDNFMRLNNEFQGQVLALNKIAEKVENDFADNPQALEFELDKQYHEILALAQDFAQNMPQIEKSFQSLFAYADERVSIAEEAYKKQKREEEIKKKLEENTGSISVKGTGVSKTVVRDLEDIEKSEAAVDSNPTRVLNFADDKNDAPVVRNAHAPVVAKPQKQDSFVIKKNDGEISGATGVIIRK